MNGTLFEMAEVFAEFGMTIDDLEHVKTWLRPEDLLRFFTEPARIQTRGTGTTCRRDVGRTGRKMGMVLRG